MVKFRNVVIYSFREESRQKSLSSYVSRTLPSELDSSLGADLVAAFTASALLVSSSELSSSELDSSLAAGAADTRPEAGGEGKCEGWGRDGFYEGQVSRSLSS